MTSALLEFAGVELAGEICFAAPGDSIVSPITTGEIERPSVTSTGTCSDALAGGLVAHVGMGLVMNAMLLIRGLKSKPTATME